MKPKAASKLLPPSGGPEARAPHRSADVSSAQTGQSAAIPEQRREGRGRPLSAGEQDARAPHWSADVSSARTKEDAPTGGELGEEKHFETSGERDARAPRRGAGVPSAGTKRDVPTPKEIREEGERLSSSGERDARAPSRPPKNPGLRELIAGKRAWAEPLAPAVQERGFRGWHARGYLPHFDVPGKTQFVTFRLHDAMPASRRSEWEAFLTLEDDKERRTQIEAYLDRGLGECHLRRPDVAKLVEDALLFFDGERYEMLAWVVMPNHVHALFETMTTPLDEVMHSWKSFTSKAANKLLRRAGDFWELEYFDRYMRDEEHFRKTVRYIENNPVRAHLVREPAQWPWSSARFRVEPEAVK